MIVKNVEKKEHNIVSFIAEVDAKEFESAVNSAYLKNKKSIAVPGFRKGKAPRMVIEGMYGKDVFYEDAINALAPKAFSQGVEEQALKTVGVPNFVDAKVNDDLTLTMQFETAVYPVVTLGAYKGLEAEKAPAEVTEDEVDKELEGVRTGNARVVTVSRPAQEGDTVVIDFEGFLDGVPFDGGKGEGYSLKLGSNQFVPGFEEQLVGVSAGEEKSLDITFPENYHANLAGKAVVFQVKVIEVKETELPVLDDEFAKDVSEFDTLEDYRASIREKLLKAAEGRAEDGFRKNLLDKAICNMEVDIPAPMIEERMDSMMREFSQNVAMQGMEVDQYFAMMGMDAQTFRGTLRPNAVNQVQAELLLHAVVQAEKIEIADEDLEAEYKNMAEMYKMEVADIKRNLSGEMIREDLAMRKAAEVIYSSGVPVTPAPKAEEDPTEAAPAATEEKAEEKPKRTRRTTKKTEETPAAEGEEKPKRTRRTTKKTEEAKAEAAPAESAEAPAAE